MTTERHDSDSQYPTWIKLPDRAKKLGVSISTLRLWVTTRVHPAPAKLGGAVRFHGPAMAAWDKKEAEKAEAYGVSVAA